VPPIDIDAEVVGNERLSGDYNVLTLAAPEIGAQTLAGQFVMVKPDGCPETLLRRPFSVFQVVRADGGPPNSISILNKRAGRTTSRLYELEPGDRIACLGPLGRPFTPVKPPCEAWMVAGGVGLAPFATLAESLASAGTPATLFYGARSAAELFHLDHFERLGVRLVLATEDGSRGAHGRVTAPLEHALGDAAAGQVMVYACGPEPMLAAVARLATGAGQPSEVSVERTMGCGLGGCYSCVIPVRHGDEHAHLVRSCIAGPVFDGAEVEWD
jgi:dihydroorotate dehydrogenase electron transfer subunit